MNKKRAAVILSAMKGLAQEFQSAPANKATVFAARDFLEYADRPRSSKPFPPDIANIMKLCGINAKNQPEGIDKIEAALAAEGQPSRALIDEWDRLACAHAYIGTIAIAVLKATRQRHGDGGWAAIRKHARVFWRDSILHDLVENIGRPTVAAHVLPVFALYEIELQQGSPISSLSIEQMGLLGL